MISAAECYTIFNILLRHAKLVWISLSLCLCYGGKLCNMLFLELMAYSIAKEKDRTVANKAVHKAVLPGKNKITFLQCAPSMTKN